MSDPTNEHNHKKLKELLDNTKSPSDDFEKEALYGFAMLDKEEAFKLKEELDRKLYPVFSNRKKTTAYWLAAAGLLLVIGFTVFFIRTDSEKEEQHLAITAPAPPKQEPVPAVIPPAEKPLEILQPGVQHTAKAPASKRMSKPPEPQAATQAEAENNARHKNKEELPDAGLVVEQKNSRAASAEAEDAKEKMVLSEKDEAAAPAPQAPASEIVNDRITFQQQSAYSTASTADKMARMPAYNIQAKKPASTKIEPAACDYTGGKEALKKDLSEKLREQNLLQAFDAVLYLNSDKAVEKVTFTHAKALTTKQRQQVTEILKTLNKFYFTAAAPKAGETAEYHLKFRP